MKNQPGSYIEMQYLKPIATGLMIGFLLTPTGLGAAESYCNPEYQLHGKLAHENLGSGIQGEKFKSTPPTWSPTENTLCIKASRSLDSKIKGSLITIKNFAFLVVDEEVDNEIEQYFASKPIKTKTLLKNHRIKLG